MKQIIQPLKGTRDFYPEQMAVRNRLYDSISNVSKLFSYQEFDGPYLEKVELYAAKSGDELVNQQSFVFPDRGGEMITLRPELTPSLARMIAQRQNELTYPLRWWSFGPFWRYEKPQKGRTREFFQWNIDLIGVDTSEADAEMISIAARFFQEVGLTPSQAKIFINDRKLMDREILDLGISESIKPGILKLIDRKRKMTPEKWNQNALAIGLSTQQLDKLNNVLGDMNLWKKSKAMERIFTLLKNVGVAGYCEFNPEIIRGLDYYTAVVFEAFDMQEEGRAILGGGHYDNLVASVGGEALPGVGFAMGDVVILQTLEKYNLLPSQKKKESVIVTVFDDEHLLPSFSLAAELRKSGIGTSSYPEAAKLDKQFKYADRMGIRFAIVIGPDEEAQSEATIKDLVNRQQEKIKKTDLSRRLLELLENH
jgi:histidyl-tRNA synthetase